MRPKLMVIVPSIIFVLLTNFVATSGAFAQQEKVEGVYFVQSLSRIKLSGDAESPFSIKNNSQASWRFWTNVVWASAVLDNPGEIYLQVENAQSRAPNRLGGRVLQAPGDPDNRIAIRLDEAADVTGTLYVPNKWDGPLETYQFSIKAEQFTAKKSEYLKVKLAQYERLLDSQLTGAAWFRFQTNAISEQLGLIDRNSTADRRRLNARRNQMTMGQTQMDRTLSLASGGMAMSENLQLDRILTIRAGEDKELFEVDDIDGITVTEFDWQPLVKDINPKLDLLSNYIPADQHVMFVPSFESLVKLIKTGFKTVGPLFPLMSETTESANILERYQTQLGLSLGEIQKLLGPKLINSIAITGGDPYFQSGTDVAVLFETSEPVALENAIKTTIAMSASPQPLVEINSGASGGVSYSSYISPDRRVSSYVATFDNVVVVTNSLVQLNRIVEVTKRPDTALAKLDEYRFFRNRHTLGDEQETALIVVTDQTIRRWCGPVWRIGTSRRARAAAVLSDLHARYLRELAGGMETPVNVEIGTSVFALNQFTVSDHAALSPKYGTLEFQTPISEMDIKQVSGREKAAYENWRRGYQSNWSTAFDPIAIRLDLEEGKLAVDLTVMPLIDNSQYQSMVDISQGAKLNAQRNSRHPEALTWGALALNDESPTLKQWANLGSSFASVNFMDWLGDAVSVYVDEDPLWADLEKAAGDEFNEEEFFQSNVHRLPLAIEFNVRSSIRLTAFLVGLRGMIEQTVPDMTVWESQRHRDTGYVKIRSSDNGRRNMMGVDDDIALYYFANADSLIFSLNEMVIKRAIDRRLDVKLADHADPAKESDPVKKVELPLLGDNFAVQVKRSLAMGMLATFNNGYQKRMQRQAWSAIPILNEWKQLFPGRDPLDIDRVVWKRELDCPGGGLYRWNEQYKTMESSVYGHPAAPKKGPHVARLLGNWEAGNFGLTFENQGLRAKFELTSPSADAAKQQRQPNQSKR